MQGNETEAMQAAQDMLDAVVEQRNIANNQIAQLAAQLQAANRKIAELEAEVKGLATPSDSTLEPQPAPKANGKDHEVEASVGV